MRPSKRELVRAVEDFDTEVDTEPEVEIDWGQLWTDDFEEAFIAMLAIDGSSEYPDVGPGTGLFCWEAIRYLPPEHRETMRERIEAIAEAKAEVGAKADAEDWRAAAAWVANLDAPGDPKGVLDPVGTA